MNLQKYNLTEEQKKFFIYGQNMMGFIAKK